MSTEHRARTPQNREESSTSSTETNRTPRALQGKRREHFPFTFPFLKMAPHAHFAAQNDRVRRKTAIVTRFCARYRLRGPRESCVESCVNGISLAEQEHASIIVYGVRWTAR